MNNKNEKVKGFICPNNTSNKGKFFQCAEDNVSDIEIDIECGGDAAADADAAAAADADADADTDTNTIKCDKWIQQGLNKTKGFLCPMGNLYHVSTETV